MHNEIPLLKTLMNSFYLHDYCTHQHSFNVSKLAQYIGKELGLSKSQLEFINLGGMFHDIGKISIPLSILNKPGKLTNEEYDIIKKHTTIGFDILSNVKCKHPIQLIALQHHEKLNGTGYPNGLTKDDILLESQIISVADITDAMMANRPYRKSRGIDKTLQELSNHRDITLHDDSCEIVAEWLIKHDNQDANCNIHTCLSCKDNY